MGENSTIVGYLATLLVFVPRFRVGHASYFVWFPSGHVGPGL